LAKRDPSALDHARAKMGEAVDFYKFVQFAFFRQWGVLRDYAHQRGIRIVGDITFYDA
jgi:4-alpha-glucanotransferase